MSETAYDWNLRRPTEQITDPEGLNLISKTTYNSAGQVTQVSQPSDTAGKGTGTTKTMYWTAGTNSEESACGNKPAWAGLPCLTRPAAEPSPAEGNPKLPWSRIVKYSVLDQPEEIKEEVNASVKRSTTMTFDTAGRPLTTSQTGEGAEIPPIETAYDEKTGRPVSQYFVCEEECADTQETHTTFDTLGRPVEYADADGNESGVKYDLLGRPVLVSDGKGAQAIAYDEASGVVTEMIDSAASTFKATYDADGKMTEQLLPNGLAQRIDYDEAGTAVGLAYEKETYCSSSCTWLDFSREYSIGGQVLHQQSTLSAQEYSYDKAGRLKLVKDSEDGQCTTRSYAFDKNSNRTSMAAHAPGEGGGCGAGWAATQTYAYDSADRLIGEGITYDNLGRITTLPDLHPRPQESWEIDGETLAELELESESFASEGELVLEFSFPAARLECQIYSEGEISGSEGIEESFTLYNCGLYKVEGGKKGAKVSCGAIEANISDYEGAGSASEMRIYLDFEKEMGCLWDMELPVSSFQHEFTDEEASELPVQTKGKASLGENPVEISASSTWYLAGKHAGHKLAFKAQGPITNEGPLSTSYYVNDLTRSQSQGGITNTYNLDASLRQRERVTTGGSEAGTQIYHYAGGSDSPAWIEEGEEWTRNIAALGGSLGAIQTSEGEVTMQLADMHGDVIATADIDPEAMALLSTRQFDEYGNPKQQEFLSGGDAELGWLGSEGRRTQLPSGVIQMGVRSYVPVLGRFLTRDPVFGGSANAYEYAAGDPVNNVDLTGTVCTKKKATKKGCRRAQRRAEERVRRSIRRVKALVREKRAEGTRNLPGMPGVNFPRLPWEDDVNEAVKKGADALAKAEEAATCEVAGLATGTGSLYIQRRANSVAKHAPEVSQALNKLSTRLGTLSLVLGVASFAGLC